MILRTMVALSLIVALGGVAASAQAVFSNPSFEEEPDGIMPNGNGTHGNPNWGMPKDWPWRNKGATNGHGDRGQWASHGDWSLYVFASTTGSHSPGDYLEFYQSVDLTDIKEIRFDAKLRGGQYTDSVFFIDGKPEWQNNKAGEYFDVPIDVTGYTGMHEIGVGVLVTKAFGSNADGWTYFDNLVAIPVPEPASLGLFALGLLLRRR